MEELTHFSQALVIERVGMFVQLEAIRTEKHQTRFQPLQPYMDQEAIVKHTRPWQQILVFFARTQKQHRWKSPQYQFTWRQCEAWEALVQQARSAREEAEAVEEAEAEEMDDINDMDDINETDRAAPDQGHHKRQARETEQALESESRLLHRVA
jgi:hypothetical protein